MTRLSKQPAHYKRARALVGFDLTTPLAQCRVAEKSGEGMRKNAATRVSGRLRKLKRIERPLRYNNDCSERFLDEVGRNREREVMFCSMHLQN
jgi:hypothetical protein